MNGFPSHICSHLSHLPRVQYVRYEDVMSPEQALEWLPKLVARHGLILQRPDLLKPVFRFKGSEQVSGARGGGGASYLSIRRTG